MRSPFPGMNPYLENPELWSEVHSRLIVAIADNLSDHLSEKYRVAIEKRTYLSGGDESLLVGIPEGVVVGKQPEKSQPAAIAVLPPLVVEPITVTVPMIWIGSRFFWRRRTIAANKLPISHTGNTCD